LQFGWFQGPLNGVVTVLIRAAMKLGAVEQPFLIIPAKELICPDHGQFVAVATVSRRHHPPTLGQLGGLPQSGPPSFTKADTGYITDDRQESPHVEDYVNTTSGTGRPDLPRAAAGLSPHYAPGI